MMDYKFSGVKPSHLAAALIAFLLFTGSFQLNQLLDQYMLFAPGVSLIFIPAGVKLLCLLVGGLPAAIGLFAASIYLSVALWTDLPTLSIYYFALISVASHAAAIALVMGRFKIRTDLGNLNYWHIVALSALAGILNGFAHNVVYLTQGVTSPADFFGKATAMAFGDFLGCFVVVLLFNLGISLMQHVRLGNR